MSTAVYREIFIGRSTFRQNYYQLQPTRTVLCWRPVLQKSHAALFWFYCLERFLYSFFSESVPFIDFIVNFYFKCVKTETVPKHIILDFTYKVRQFNSRNGPVKTTFACLCNSGCCRLRNTYYPCEAMHFVLQWCHCRRQSWKSFSGISSSNIVTLRWMSGMSANFCHFRAIFFFFNFDESQKSQGAKSGE
jgi:hypothetical protein